MPQLEILLVTFDFPDHSLHVGGQFMHTAIAALVTLPNLRHFTFQGVTAYLEALLYQISAPRLERLQIAFFNQLTFSVPRLLHFVGTTENLRFKTTKLKFSDRHVDVEVYPHEEADMCALSFAVNSCHLDWQVSSMAQIFNALGPVLSAVEHLIFEHEYHSQSSEEHNEVDPTEWRKLLYSFRHVKTLRIAEGLVEELTRCLQFDDGKLSYSGSGNTGGAFTSFIDACQNAGRPITVIHS